VLEVSVAMSSVPEVAPPATTIVPLVVDLDGTLICTDLMVESTFAYLGADPRRVFNLLWASRRGKAVLKAEVAANTDIDVSNLPYDEFIVSLIREARAEGRPVYLASASNESYVRKVADHMMLFDGWFGSTDDENLSSTAKAHRLVAAFGAGGFDYIGNDRDDLDVWCVARRRIAVRISAASRSKLEKMDPAANVLEAPRSGPRVWIRLLRVHQWTKNSLVFLPLVTGHWFDLGSIAKAIGAFFAFSMAASAIYIVNDLVDLEADRKHATKKHRPLAVGSVPILQAVSVAPLLLVSSLVGAYWIAPSFGGVLFAYVVLTTAYTFVLKRKLIVDVIALASLYTIRVIGGAAAISASQSEWILGFSMFVFTALALIKRYVELAGRLDAELPDPSNRNYRKTDLNVIACLAAASGFNAVTVFALYISSDSANQLYKHPKALWLICPILMYWLARALVMAHRREMDDDPIVFALRDWNSLLAFALVSVIMLAAL
jgi:4-hydroxybenzoate polyprenyltransferase